MASMIACTRRAVVQVGAMGLVSAGLGIAQPPGERRRSSAPGVAVENPRCRVPVSLIIDDSTCLVNMAHFGIPQFAEVFPDQYRQPWKTLPREIPDSFVREFAEWCQEHGVRGKYSMVPYPACVGWLDRWLPGWSRKELEDSLELVRSTIAPTWDIHPEMVSHTRVVDLKTGRPYPDATARYMENWDWTAGRSADEIAEYMAYALRILKAVGLRCEGVTTPGGFGNQVLPELARATLESCRDVFGAEIPHYFRHVFEDERSVAPRVEYASGLDSPSPRCVVSIIGCTGDWFGGWDGLTPGSPDRFISADLQRGRLVEVIARGEPAIMVCHWPGLYFNGRLVGFGILKEVVRRLEQRYSNLVWMNLSQISRYWAAKELTRIERRDGVILLHAPYACPSFTLSVASRQGGRPRLVASGEPKPLAEAANPLGLRPGTWCRTQSGLVACFDLPRGDSELHV